MKKLIILAVLFLSACGSNEKSSAPAEETEPVEKTTEKSEQELENEPTQEELNEKTKAEAVAIDYDEFYGSNPPLKKKVFIDGEIADIRDDGPWDILLLNTGDGTYPIMSTNTTDVAYEIGDVVRVYGTITEYNSETHVFSAFVEKDEVASENSRTAVTKEEAEQIKEGMTYAEVIAIIGVDGEQTTETVTDSFTHTAYKWNNDDGSYAFIQFNDLNTNEPVVSSFMFDNLK